MPYKFKLKNIVQSFHIRINKFKNLYKMTNNNDDNNQNHHSQQTSAPTIIDNQTNRQNRKDVSILTSLFLITTQLLHRFLVLIVRQLLQLFLGKHGQSMPPIKDLTLLEPATVLAYKIRTRKISSVEVMKSFIERINEINPLLNCVVDNCFEDALKDASDADALILSGKYTEDQLAELKPFLGVPISTKDCIKVKGMLNTAGLWVRRLVIANEDADAMLLMRNAGAIPFALTNVSECCMWWESSNTVHGRTRNAYDTNRIVGGSSGGEGCLQSAAGSPIGLGSDIGGSIRMPAFFNGIFGHKPSKFIVSNYGQVPAPFSEEQNSFLGIGPMCRYASDLKPILKIISGKNAKKLNLDEPVNIKNIKIYYQFNDGGGRLISPIDNDLNHIFAKVIKHFQQLNNNKNQPKHIKFEKFRQSAAIWFANMKDTSGKGFEWQLLDLKDKINPIIELFKWLIGISKHTFIGILTAIIEKGQPQFGDPKHKYLVEKRNELLNEIQNTLGDDGVLLYPTHPTVAPYHNEPIIRTLNFSYTGIINCLGLPATAIPLGIGSEGLPLGLQVVGNINQDRLCLAVATELEKVFGGWVPPTIST